MFLNLYLAFCRMYDAFLAVNRLPYEKKYGIPPNARDPVRLMAEMARMPIESRVKKMQDFRPSVLAEFELLKDRFPEKYAEVEEWDPLVEYASELEAAEKARKLTEASFEKLTTTATVRRSKRNGKRKASPSLSQKDCNDDQFEETSKRNEKKAKNSTKTSSPPHTVKPIMVTIFIKD